MLCGKWESFPREFAKCRRCRKAKYCGKECQSTAWSEGHRFWCSAKDADEHEGEGHSRTHASRANGESARTAAVAAINPNPQTTITITGPNEDDGDLLTVQDGNRRRRTADEEEEIGIGATMGATPDVPTDVIQQGATTWQWTSPVVRRLGMDAARHDEPDVMAQDVDVHDLLADTVDAIFGTDTLAPAPVTRRGARDDAMLLD
jgi:hypothetical protein